MGSSYGSHIIMCNYVIMHTYLRLYGIDACACTVISDTAIQLKIITN